MNLARRLVSTRQYACLESPLSGVSNEVWGKFYRTLKIQPSDQVSESGGLGAFDIRPRRLVELKYAEGLRTERTAKGRQIHVCEFFLPWTEEKFLEDSIAQYVAFRRSMLLYYTAMTSGELKLPEGVSKAGALAILHRGGEGALKSWPNIFSDTRAVFDRVQGLF